MASPGRELSSINFEAMLGGPLIAVVNAQAQAAMSSVNFIKAVGFKQGNTDDPTNPQTGDPVYVSFKYPKEVSPFQPEVAAQVTGVTVTVAGSGYETPPAVTPTAAGGGPGTGLTLAATLNADGGIAGITVTDPGSGYTAPPTIAIAGPTGPGGVPAEATANLAPKREAVPAVFQTMMLEVPILTMLPIPFIRIEETTIDFKAKIISVVSHSTDQTLDIDTETGGRVRYPPLFSIASVSFKVTTAYQKTTKSSANVTRDYSMDVHIRAVQDDMPAGLERILGILEDGIQSQPINAPVPIEA